MGTSTGYKMPTGGDWSPLKREATDFVQHPGAERNAPQALLRHYLRVRTSSSGPESGRLGTTETTGRESGSRGGTRSWSAGTATAQGIGGFFSRVGEVGLAEALREVGLGELVGHSASEVSGALLEKLAGPASTLDQAAARKALVDLNDELLADAETFEDVEELLTKSIDQGGLFEILVRFFGHYLYERFCADFYERFLKKVGAAQARRSMKDIRDCINAAIETKLAGRDLSTFQWSGREGKALAEQALQEVLDIFGVSI